jgi:predicted nucleotidyltransferase
MIFHKSILSMLNPPLKLKIIAFLLKKEVLMSEREFSCILGVSHMSVNRTMQELESIHFVRSRRVGRAHVWTVNHKSYARRIFSELVEALSNTRSPIDDLKETIVTNLPLRVIDKLVLFGSVARQDERPGSDIDLFVLVRDEADKNEIETPLETLSLLCFEKYGNPLSPYILCREDLKKKKGLKLLTEIDSGLVLYRRGTDNAS